MVFSKFDVVYENVVCVCVNRSLWIKIIWEKKCTLTRRVTNRLFYCSASFHSIISKMILSVVRFLSPSACMHTFICQSFACKLDMNINKRLDWLSLQIADYRIQVHFVLSFEVKTDNVSMPHILFSHCAAALKRRKK